MLLKNQSVGIEIDGIKRPRIIDADTEQRRLEINERVYTASEQGKNSGVVTAGSEQLQGIIYT